MRKLHYIYLKPQQYFGTLIVYFILISCCLSLVLTKFNSLSWNYFFLTTFLILFLLLTLSALFEIIKKSDYMSPLEIYDIQHFFNDFLNSIKKLEDMTVFFHKYDTKSKNRMTQLFRRDSKYVLNSITKKKDIYEITYFDADTICTHLFFNFFLNKTNHKMYVKKYKEGLKIAKLK